MNGEDNSLVESNKSGFFSKVDGFFDLIRRKANWLIYSFLFVIIWVASSIRLSNLPLLKDTVTGSYIPTALDPYYFLRYAQHILEHGSLMAHDVMRYSPLGTDVSFSSSGVIVSYVNVYLYKIFSIFNNNITLEFVNVIYPVVFFILAMLAFFFLVKRLFNPWVALLATAFLSFIPSFLYRTTAGFSDKEALGIFLMFMAFYFFVVSWQVKTIKSALLFGGLSGISTVFLGLTWGGVKFVFLIFGLFILVEFFLDKLKDVDYFSYFSWGIVTFGLLSFAVGYSLKGFFSSISTQFAILGLFLLLFDWFVFRKNCFNLGKKFTSFVGNKLPISVAKFMFTLVLGLIGSTILFGFNAIFGRISAIVTGLLYTMQGTRVAVTVAEQNQPYVVTWLGQFGGLFFWMFFIGSIVLFYTMLKPLAKKRGLMISIYGLFLFCFIFSRYSPNAGSFNGETFFAKLLYIGSLIGFVLFVAVSYLIAFKKDKELFGKISLIDKKYIFVLIWFLIVTVAARSAIRLLFVFSPVICLVSAYFIYVLFKKSFNLKNKYVKLIALFAVLAILILPVNGSLNNFVKKSSASAERTGPSYNPQWQEAMSWVRENTPEDAIFAHWWDYGYWVQTGGERTTVTDGGHFTSYWDYLIGRHVLTAQNETEALEFLFTHNVTNLLIINDEIGKYGAYSSIGSDLNYDRYSWIASFTADKSRTQERREDTLVFYAGGTALDEDFIFNDQLFPGKKAGIGAIIVPTRYHENGQITFAQPEVIMIYSGKQYNVPLECLFVDGKEIIFNKPGLKGCFKLIPSVRGSSADNFGSGIYLSPRVRRTLFTKLFLYGEDSEYFKIIYDDSDKIPLMNYNGRLVGPLKIWDVNYPEDIEFKEEYLKLSYSDTKLKENKK